MSYVLIKGKYKCTVCEISAKNVFIKTFFFMKIRFDVTKNGWRCKL